MNNLKPVSNSKSQRYFVGRQIRAYKVLCIDDKNNNLGVIPLSEALSLAEENNLDLVQMTFPNRGEPPTCKILDYGKFKYDLQKKEKQARQKQREAAVKIKEIKFRPTTDLNDLRIKANHAREFLDDNCRVKVMIMFKGRELSHQEIAQATLNTFLSFIPNAKCLEEPILTGRVLTAIISW